MNIHEQFESLVDVYVSGGLDDSDRGEFAAHAGACTACATLLRDAEEFARWVRGSIAPDAPPADLEDRIIARFRGTAAPKRRWLPNIRIRVPRWIGVAAAAVLLIVLGAVFMKSDAYQQTFEGWSSYDDYLRAKEIARRGVEHAEVALQGIGKTETWTTGATFGLDPHSDSESGFVEQKKRTEAPLVIPPERIGEKITEMGRLVDRLDGSPQGERDYQKFLRAYEVLRRMTGGDPAKANELDAYKAKAEQVYGGAEKLVERGERLLADIDAATRTGHLELAQSKLKELKETRGRREFFQDERVVEVDKLVRQAEQKLANAAGADAEDARDANAQPRTAALPDEPQDQPRDERKIIYTATLNLEVESYDATYAKIGGIVSAGKGFIAGANTQKLANGKILATVTVRIPPERFEETLAKLRVLGSVRNQNIASQDVTKAYLDLDARLKSKETLVERLKKILLEAKGNVKELMEVEVQMGKTIEEIEAIKGELKYYDNMIGLSTITITIAEKDLGQPFEYVQTLQSTIALTVREPDAAYAAAQKAVTDAGGQVADCKMTRQSDGSASAFVRGRVDADKFPAVREALRKLGHVDTDTVDVRQTARGGQEGAPKPDAPVKKEQAVIDLTIGTPEIHISRKGTLTIETGDAVAAHETARRAVESAGGRVLESPLTSTTDGVRGLVRAQLDAAKFAALVDALKGLGKVKHETVSHNAPPSAAKGDQPLLREEGTIELTLVTPPALIAEQHGIGKTIRDTFTNSFAGLMWSIEKLFVGLSLAGPWLVLAAIVWLLWRRLRAKKAAPPTAPAA